MLEFIWHALVAGLGIAMVVGPLGTFIVWRRMSYFGDALSHSALLGVGLGIALEVNPYVTVILVCTLLAVLLASLQTQRVATDTLLGILSHSALSAGLILVSFMDSVRVDLMAYLFGDLLAVSSVDLVWIYGGGFVVLLVLFLLWQPLVSATVHEELAAVEGVDIKKMRVILMLMTALVIAVAMKIVGILLITSMLIIPAAAARRLAKTPEQMALGAVVIGMLSVVGGILLSLNFDTPVGPSIVICCALCFLTLLVLVPERN